MSESRRTLVDCAIIFFVICLLIAPLFKADILIQWDSIESTFIADARTTPLTAPTSREASPLRRALERLRGDPAYQSFTLLRVGFTVLPIVFGADKFANVLVNWERYLAPWVAHRSEESR